ncbi:MAG: hypothetical protein VYE11_03160 [Pseudomonadota bacterium]|nr:hypothetical protein [Pseudomonadota bacterium]
MKTFRIIIYIVLFSLTTIVLLFGFKPFKRTVDSEITLIKELDQYPTTSYRLSDGTYLVSVRTSMPEVKTYMVRWWFSDFLKTSEHYRLWHPKDHVWMDWESKEEGKIIGASHLVHEYIGENLRKLRIQFVDSSEFFGHNINNKDTFAICARVGELERDLNIAKMCHVVINTKTGAEMRSRFWMGHIAKRKKNEVTPSLLGYVGNTALIRMLIINKKSAEDLKKHAKEEMKFLGEILPDLYQSQKVEYK